jgi:transcriptional regulator of acetoin/glycerol metabolism
VRAAHDDLVRAGMPRVNMLVAGEDGTVGRLLETLRGHFEQPVASWSPGQSLVLPPVERTGTMLIRQVGALALQDQITLLEWLAAAAGRTQVVSTTSTPLLPQVRAGAFIDTLYYRLNTVYVDVTA